VFLADGVAIEVTASGGHGDISLALAGIQAAIDSITRTRP
jgi:hypothetical protein